MSCSLDHSRLYALLTPNPSSRLNQRCTMSQKYFSTLPKHEISRVKLTAVGSKTNQRRSSPAQAKFLRYKRQVLVQRPALANHRMHFQGSVFRSLYRIRIQPWRCTIPKYPPAKQGASADVQLAILHPSMPPGPPYYHPQTRHFVALKKFRLDDDSGDRAGLVVSWLFAKPKIIY